MAGLANHIRIAHIAVKIEGKYGRLQNYRRGADAGTLP